MRFGMRHIEGPAESVAELVVQGHSDCTEACTTEPSTIKGLLPSRKGGGVGDNVREGA